MHQSPHNHHKVYFLASLTIGMDNDLLYFILVIIAVLVVFSILFIGMYIVNNAETKSKYCDKNKDDWRPFIAGQCHNT
ncbi:MAG: hypothetical protein R3321_05555 [Nitrososphaeraceae archaeon]|nr:hypothetical protein [Nitrososphaeraceae archaeon]